MWFVDKVALPLWSQFSASIQDVRFSLEKLRSRAGACHECGLCLHFLATSSPATALKRFLSEACMIRFLTIFTYTLQSLKRISNLCAIWNPIVFTELYYISFQGMRISEHEWFKNFHLISLTTFFSLCFKIFVSHKKAQDSFRITEITRSFWNILKLFSFSKRVK